MVIILGFIILSLIIEIAGDLGGSPSSATSDTSSSTSQSTPTAQPTSKPGSQWRYSHDKDPMTGKAIDQAAVQSTNTVNFEFPYNGAQHASLILRTHPRYGKDVIFSIEKGQIPCTSYDGCKVTARFDDHAPVTYIAYPASNGKTSVIFIKNYHGFVGKMLHSKAVKISVGVYQEGNPIFNFNVGHFSVTKYLPKRN